MGMKALVTGAMMASLAGGAMAQTLDPVRVEMFRSILKGNECTLTEVAAGNILPRFDFSKEETRAIVGALVAAGEVQLDGNTLMLVDGSCGTGDAVADLLGQRDVQQFIAVMAENSCAMTEADGEAIFTARGMTKAQVGAIVGPMIQAGMASFDAGVLTVDSTYCAAPVMAEETPNEASVPADMAELDRSGMFGMSRVRQLVDLMAQNSCTLNMEVADGYLGEAGIEHSFAAFIGRKMLSDGFASMADGENLVLSAPYCISAGGETVVAEVEMPVEAPMEAPVELPISTLAMVEKLGEREIAFLEVVEQNGCALNIVAAEALLADAGLRMDQAYQIVDSLMADGNASLSNDGALVSFNPVLCGSEIQPVEQVAQSPGNPASPEGEVIDGFVADREAAAAQMEALLAENEARIAAAMDAQRGEAQLEADPRAGVLAMLALNSCEISQSNAAEMISAAGLDFNTSMQMLTQMMGSGEATSPDGGQTLQVSAPLCVAAGVEPKTPRAAFINLIKQNNCSVTAAEFSALLPVDGLDATTAFAMISELEAEGVITLPATRDVVTLSAEMCR